MIDIAQQNVTIIDGKEISKKILSKLADRIDQSNICKNSPITLAIILVGNDPASSVYIKNKIKAAKKVGIYTEFKHFESDIQEDQLLKEVRDLNDNSSISGIIVQMPLPDHINKLTIITALSPDKDVDGFHPVNTGLLYSTFQHRFVPCTAMGCLKLLKSCKIQLAGQNVVIVGRSNIVGRPLAALLLKENSTVTICHSHSKHLSSITSKADIVISAIGKRHCLTKEYFNNNAIVLDVGINRVSSDNAVRFTGDVDFHDVKHHVRYITPVPGGVGPMTVAYLLINTYIAAACNQYKSQSTQEQCDNLYYKFYNELEI